MKNAVVNRLNEARVVLTGGTMGPRYDDDVSPEYLAKLREKIARDCPATTGLKTAYDFSW